MTTIWEDDFYNQTELGKLAQAVSEYQRTGDPQAAYRLEAQMADHTPFSEIALDDAAIARRGRPTIRPETTVNLSLVEEPPRAGKGSGQPAWVIFAEMVTDTEPEVLDSLGRDEIIQLLIDRDVIDAPE